MPPFLILSSILRMCSSVTFHPASNRVLSIRCLDPAIAIKPVFERFSTVVITSGTISPLDMYPKMLQFTPVVQETYSMTLTSNSFLPLVSHSASCRADGLRKHGVSWRVSRGAVGHYPW